MAQAFQAMPWPMPGDGWLGGNGGRAGALWSAELGSRRSGVRAVKALGQIGHRRLLP